MPMGDALAPGPLPWRTPWREALCPFGGVSYAQSRISWHFPRATTYFETFRLGEIPFRGVWPGRAPCPWATPWRQALCPGARPFARSEVFRTRNHASLGISPGQPTISRRFAWAKSHFGAFGQGVRLAHGRRPGARHFALANALALGPLPVRSRFCGAITHLLAFPQGNHPLRDVSPGQNPISGRFAMACAIPMGDALAPGTLPLRKLWAMAFARSELFRTCKSVGESPKSRSQGDPSVHAAKGVTLPRSCCRHFGTGNLQGPRELVALGPGEWVRGYRLKTSEAAEGIALFWGGGTNLCDAGLDLSGSWQQGHSATYNAPSRI